MLAKINLLIFAFLASSSRKDVPRTFVEIVVAGILFTLLISETAAKWNISLFFLKRDLIIFLFRMLDLINLTSFLFGETVSNIVSFYFFF